MLDHPVDEETVLEVLDLVRSGQCEFFGELISGCVQDQCASLQEQQTFVSAVYSVHEVLQKYVDDLIVLVRKNIF